MRSRVESLSRPQTDKEERVDSWSVFYTNEVKRLPTNLLGSFFDSTFDLLRQYREKAREAAAREEAEPVQHQLPIPVPMTPPQPQQHPPLAPSVPVFSATPAPPPTSLVPVDSFVGSLYPPPSPEKKEPSFTYEKSSFFSL